MKYQDYWKKNEISIKDWHGWQLGFNSLEYSHQIHHFKGYIWVRSCKRFRHKDLKGNNPGRGKILGKGTRRLSLIYLRISSKTQMVDTERTREKWLKSERYNGIEAGCICSEKLTQMYCYMIFSSTNSLNDFDTFGLILYALTMLNSCHHMYLYIWI